MILIFGGCACSGYNGLVAKDENVKNKWANVQSDYQRRSDLIPNLVNTVKGAANFEQTTLTNVIEARAKATQVQINANDLTPENLAKFQQAQAGLSGALGKLLAVAEAARPPAGLARRGFTGRGRRGFSGGWRCCHRFGCGVADGRCRLSLGAAHKGNLFAHRRARRRGTD